jgi:hypothetical protein
MNYYRRMIEQPLAPLIDALLEGDQEQAISEALRVRQNGIGHELIIGGAIETAMGRLDAKCTLEQFNLLEIMLVGRAVTGVMKALYPDAAPPPTKCTVVLASLEGDIHDLGKNIVKTLLSAKGYRVVDCGKDCPVELLVNTADQEQARVIGIHAEKKRQGSLRRDPAYQTGDPVSLQQRLRRRIDRRQGVAFSGYRLPCQARPPARVAGKAPGNAGYRPLSR